MEASSPDPNSSDDDALPPRLHKYLLEVYHDTREAYTQAGCPFGKSESAMLIWYHFDLPNRKN